MGHRAAALHQLWPLLPDAQPVPAIASLTSYAEVIRSAANTVASERLHGAEAF